MAYEPTQWKTGDVVTSNKLNKLEQGVAGSAKILIVGATFEDGAMTLDKTWQEIHDAEYAVVKSNNMGVTAIGYVSMVGQLSGAYAVQVYIDEAFTLCTIDSADGYPVEQASDPDPDPTTQT